MGSNYVPGEKKDLFNKSVQRTVLCMGRKQEAVEDVPCGNTVALVGLDAFIQKNATLCDQSATDAFPIKAMKFSVRDLLSHIRNLQVSLPLSLTHCCAAAAQQQQ
jgi:elongation factor 2